MTSTELLGDAFSRIREVVYEAADGLTPEQLAFRPGPGANSIGWLVWHLARVQDDYIAAAAGIEQAWTADGWAERFGLPLPVDATGYGHSSDDVAAVRVSSDSLLTGYYDAVHEQTARFVARLTDSDLAQVVDTRWDPPVTLAVRLISVISDDLQHAGQAAYIRGLIKNGIAG